MKPNAALEDDELEPSETAIALHKAEAEIAQLRTTVRQLESVLRAAGRVLSPYVNRLGSGR